MATEKKDRSFGALVDGFDKGVKTQSEKMLEDKKASVGMVETLRQFIFPTASMKSDSAEQVIAEQQETLTNAVVNSPKAIPIIAEAAKAQVVELNDKYELIKNEKDPAKQAQLAGEVIVMAAGTIDPFKKIEVVGEALDQAADAGKAGMKVARAGDEALVSVNNVDVYQKPDSLTKRLLGEKAERVVNTVKEAITPPLEARLQKASRLETFEMLDIKHGSPMGTQLVEAEQKILQARVDALKALAETDPERAKHFNLNTSNKELARLVRDPKNDGVLVMPDDTQLKLGNSELKQHGADMAATDSKALQPLNQRETVADVAKRERPIEMSDYERATKKAIDAGADMSAAHGLRVNALRRALATEDMTPFQKKVDWVKNEMNVFGWAFHSSMSIGNRDRLALAGVKPEDYKDLYEQYQKHSKGEGPLPEYLSRNPESATMSQLGKGVAKITVGHLAGAGVVATIGLTAVSRDEEEKQNTTLSKAFLNAVNGGSKQNFDEFVATHEKLKGAALYYQSAENGLKSDDGRLSDKDKAVLANVAANVADKIKLEGPQYFDKPPQSLMREEVVPAVTMQHNLER